MMSFGSTYPPAETATATYSGLRAVVERSKHVYIETPVPPATQHSWQSDDDGVQIWIEDPHLKATRVTWNSDEKPNYAEIIMEGTRVENWQTFLDPADQLRVVLLSQETTINDNGESESTTQRRIVFRGFPATVLVSASDNDESVVLGCLGWRYYANRITCYGQKAWDAKNSTDFNSGFKLVFNEGGRMNRMSGGGGNNNGRNKSTDTAINDKYFLFTWAAIAEYSSNWQDHDFWTVGQALEYLFNRFKDPDATLDQVFLIPRTVMRELAEIRLPETDVEGLSLSDAVTKILTSVGYHWCVVPNLETGAWVVKTWKPGAGVGSADVHFPAVGSDLSAMQVSNQANRFEINYDFRSIVNDYIGIGARGRYEKAWDIVAAWDPSLEGAPDAKYYRSGKDETANPDWETYKYIFRRWAIDGAGLITGTLPDFGTTIGSNYMDRPRHLDDQALTPESDDEGVRKPAEVFVKHDGTWKRMDGNVDVFSEGFADGIYLDGKQITVDGGPEGEDLVDVMKDVTDVEIISALDGDIALQSERSDAGSKADYLTRQKALRLSDYKFEYRNASTRNYGNPAIIRDDTTKLQTFLDQKLSATKSPVISVSITTPLIYFALTPGTTIGKISGREIEIGSEIVSVDMMLDPEQSCQLVLADLRMRRFT